MDNKNHIISCALELFASKGYEAIGVQEIADTAGITKPTLYHYFGSKYGLLDTIVNEKYANLEKELKVASFYNGDLPLTLHRVVSCYFGFVNNNAVFYRMQLCMIFSPPDSDPYRCIKPLIERQLNILEEVFLLASKDHGNMRGRNKIYAKTFLGMINTYVHLWLSGEIEFNEETTFKALHQFMHGIYS